ncbi:hypothetical protein VWM73_11845, partial [Campylobacter coli]
NYTRLNQEKVAQHMQKERIVSVSMSDKLSDSGIIVIFVFSCNDEPMNTYSSGMSARIAFGLSMAFDFDYYLIDEAGAVGDPKFR